jgi:hypothetical protein
MKSLRNSFGGLLGYYAGNPYAHDNSLKQTESDPLNDGIGQHTSDTTYNDPDKQLLS